MANISSTLPSPEFFDKMEQLSTKKQRGTPRRNPPPMPPVKSAQPFSRFFQVNLHASTHKALAVSFQNADNSILSKYYNEMNPQTYFSQCFEIVSKLGTGSFGEVFKVRSREDNKFYAVKKSRVPFRSESDRLRKLEEVKKHEQLPNHPHCTQFVKAWEEKQELYIQTELCETSLSNFADVNHDIAEKLVWKYLVDLLLATKHLHDHNLAHMDIKPDNIFISRGGICKLGDFGLVLDITKSDFSEAVEGDPKYLAPELMEGKFTTAADVFSLGITLLELACDLDLPVGGSAWHDLRNGQIPSDFTRHLSHDLKEVICKMMTADYKRRPAVDKILAHHAVSRVLRKRRCELFYKHIISTAVMVTFAIVSIVQQIILWPWRTCSNLVNKRYSSNIYGDDDDDIQCWKPTSSETELAFSDDECFDENKRTSEIFNDSVPNFDVRLSQSTPVVMRHRNSSQKDAVQQLDRPSGYNSFAFSPNSSADRSVIVEEPCNLSNNEDRISMILPRNLTQLFDSLSDED